MLEREDYDRILSNLYVYFTYSWSDWLQTLSLLIEWQLVHLESMANSSRYPTYVDKRSIVICSRYKCKHTENVYFYKIYMLEVCIMNIYVQALTLSYVLYLRPFLHYNKIRMKEKYKQNWMCFKIVQRVYPKC